MPKGKQRAIRYKSAGELPECPICGAAIGPCKDYPWHYRDDDCRAIRQPKENPRHNPASVIPRSWKQAKVRRLKDGRVQVMISGGVRNPSTLPKMARPSKKGSGWVPMSTGRDKSSASALASYYRGLGWKSRVAKRGTKYDVLVARLKRK